MRLHAGEVRQSSLLFDLDRLPAGTLVSVDPVEGLWVNLRGDVVPRRGEQSWSRLAVDLRAAVSVEPGQWLTVVARAAEESAELRGLVVRHTRGGWVREIVRKDEDSRVEAEFEPERGIVTVYEGRPEFRRLERAARRGGIARKACPRVPPLPHVGGRGRRQLRV